MGLSKIRTQQILFAVFTSGPGRPALTKFLDPSLSIASWFITSYNAVLTIFEPVDNILK